MVSENYEELHRDVGRDCLEVKYGGVLPNKLNDFFPPDMHMLGEKMVEEQPPTVRCVKKKVQKSEIMVQEPAWQVALELQAFTYTIDNNNLVDFNDRAERIRHDIPLITKTNYLYRQGNIIKLLGQLEYEKLRD